MFKGANLTLNSDVDQDTYMFGPHERSQTNRCPTVTLAVVHHKALVLLLFVILFFFVISCYCSLTLHPGAMGWSVACDCAISWS